MLIHSLFYFAFLHSIYAEDVSNWHLPENAKARLGKGNINEIQYTPDGKILAVATDIGIWLYDTDTYKEIALLGAHTEEINSIDFSADGSILAYDSGYDIVLWDMLNNSQKTVIEGTNDYDVLSVAISPNGKTIASGTYYGKTYLYDVETGIKKATYSIRGHKIAGVEFSPDGQSLLIEGTDSTRSKTILLIDVNTHKELGKITVNDDDMNGIAFSPDGKKIVCASQKKDNLLLWDIQHTPDHEENKNIKCWISWSVTFSPDSNMIAVGGLGEVTLYDADTGKQIGFHPPNTGQVISVAFSPDGKTLASATDHQVYLWDIVSAQPITTIDSDSENMVKSIAISPDGRNIASGGMDECLTLWDAVTGIQKKQFELNTGTVNTIAFTPDGNTLAVGTKGVLHVLDMPTSQIKSVRLAHLGRILSLMFSPDGKTLACGGSSGLVVLIDVNTQKQKVTLRGHEEYVNSVKFNPDGTLLASGGEDKKVLLWNAITGEKLNSIDAFDGQVWSLAFSPDGNNLAIAGREFEIGLLNVKTNEYTSIPSGIFLITDMSYSADGNRLVTSSRYGIHLWDMEKGRTAAAFIGHAGNVSSVKFNPMNGLVVSGGDDGTIRIWNKKGGDFKDIATGFIEAVSSVAYSPDGNTFATTGGKYAARIWDSTTFELKSVIGWSRAPQTITFSPDGSQIATGGLSDNVELWDVDTGKQTALLEGHTDAIETIAYNPDGETLLSGGRDGLIIVWDLDTGKEKDRLNAHQTGSNINFMEWVNDIEYSPDGNTFASARHDAILLWDVATKKYREIKVADKGIQCLAFHPYGSIIASGHYDGVFLWHATTGEQIDTLIGHSHTVISVAFSPDGKILASGGGGDDRKVILWDVTMTKEIATLTGHTGGVRSVAFSPDSNTLVSGSWDGTALIWDISQFR